MRVKRFLVLAAIVLCAVGVYLSAELLAQHLLGQPAGGLASVLCGPEGGGCDRVMNSRWSALPPYPPGHSAHSRGDSVYGKASGKGESPRGVHVPVPILGLLYFSFLLTWFLGVGCPNQRGRRWQVVPFFAVLAGNIGSGVFIYLMARVIRAWCPECMAVHAVNFALLVLVVATCPRRWKATGASAEKGASVPAPDTPPVVAHPTVRLAMVTIALAMSLWLMGIMAAAATSSYIQVSKLKGVVEEVCAHPDVLAALYAAQRPAEIPIRADDPCSGAAGEAPAVLVGFTAPTWPSCQEFEEFLAKEIQPLFGSTLRVILKYYPLTGECNRYSAARRSGRACRAAYAAEAARLQGGNEAFWRMLAEIRARSDEPGAMDYAEMATRAKLDAKRLVEDLTRPEVRDRVTADVELAYRLGVESTPTMFLNGKRVPMVAQIDLGFWKRMAADFTMARGAGLAGARPTSRLTP